MELKKVNEVIYVPLSLIDANPYQPRKVFSKEHIDQLAASIKSYGVIQPISLRKNGERYELIIGERRFRASQVAEMTHIPAIVVDVDNEDSAVAALVENILRVDLSFLEEAEAIRKLMDIHNLNQIELSKRLGMSQSTLSNKLRVLMLPDQIKIKLTESFLTERHARALLKLDDESIMRKVLEKVVEGSWSVKKTEEYIEQLIVKSQKKRRLQKRSQMKTAISYKVYLNTVKQTYKTMIASNPEIAMEEDETDDCIVVKIVIPKN